MALTFISNYFDSMCEDGAESNCNASVVTVEAHTLQKLADGEGKWLDAFPLLYVYQTSSLRF